MLFYATDYIFHHKTLVTAIVCALRCIGTYTRHEFVHVKLLASWLYWTRTFGARCAPYCL